MKGAFIQLLELVDFSRINELDFVKSFELIKLCVRYRQQETIDFVEVDEKRHRAVIADCPFPTLMNET